MIRRMLLFLLVLVVVGAIRGAAALVAIGDGQPIHWLGAARTMLFAMPAVVALTAGASSLIVLVALAMRIRIGSVLAGLPGLILAVYVALDLLIPGPAPSTPIPIAIGCGMLGLAVLALAITHGSRGVQTSMSEGSSRAH